MKKKLKNSKGITLIALIITIIILLILAGISISALTQTGLFSRAKQAEQLSKEKQEEESDLIKDIYYKLFINNGNNYLTYWMSSRCVDVDSGGARFRIRFVDSGNVSADYLCYSDNGEISKNYAFRPVVTLNTDVQIDTSNSGNGSTAELAYVIK